MASDATGLQTEERREKICEIINREGKVRVEELSRMFGLSTVSIRADLNELESQGRLKRIHGGAVRRLEHYYYGSLEREMTANVKEKKLIGEMAASLIDDYDTILVNNGTTGVYTLAALSGKKGIIVITHSLFTAQEAMKYSNITTYLLGGKLDPQLPATTGERVIEQLNEISAEKALISFGGIDSEMGLTTRFMDEAMITRAMISRAITTIGVCASRKIGHISRIRIVPLDRVDMLITDTQALPSSVEMFRKNGVEVHLA